MLALLPWVLAAAASPTAPRLPDLDALVAYQTRQVLASGVTRVETWQEHLVRRGDRVWTERVLPPQAPRHADAAPDHAAHKHFDYARAARLLSREAGGGVDLRFIDTEHRVAVSVPAAEFGAVGFDGRWDAAASLVPPSLVERLPAEDSSADAAAQPGAVGRRGAVAQGARWRVQKVGDWTHRVLWSDAQQLALRIESRRADGSFERTVVATPQAPRAAAALPWRDLTSYTTRQYDDFLD